jgi:cbb3-type cytochrome oxidase subunit 1
VNGVLFGWLSMAQVGAAFYMIPRLCGNRLWNESLGVWTGWLWNLTIVLGVVTLLGGYNQGREYAELVWPLDVAVLALLLLSGLNVFATVATRREKKLYVTTWYVMGAFIWMPILYFVGNAMWETGNFWHQSGAIGGINDATLNWFYGHGVLGMWFTPMGVALAYYFIPTLARTHAHSHALSMLGFWTIAFMYPMVATTTSSRRRRRPGSRLWLRWAVWACLSPSSLCSLTSG